DARLTHPNLLRPILCLTDNIHRNEPCKQYWLSPILALDTVMDQPLRLVLPNPTLAPRSTLDLQLGSGLMARNPLPRHPIDGNRILPLHRWCLKDRRWQVRNLRQPRPSLRCANLLSP